MRENFRFTTFVLLQLLIQEICAAAATNSGDTRQYSNDKATEAIAALLIYLYPDGIHERDNYGKTCLDVVQNIKQREGRNSHAEAILRVIRKYEEPEDRRNKESTGVVPDYRDDVLTSTRKSSSGETSKRHNIDGGNQANSKKLLRTPKGQGYEKQMEELNQDNEECRTLLKDQTDKFDAKIRSLTSAHEAAVAEMHSSWKRHEANLDDQMKSLKAQLNSAQEQLELGRATESHWRSKHSALESRAES
jgi:hypothetical protein